MARSGAGSGYLLKKQSVKQKAMTLRIPADLHDAITGVRQKADALGLVFDVHAVLIDALKSAIRSVEVELSDVQRNANGTESSPTRRRESKSSGTPK